MNESLDPLEQELAALQPREPSSELRQRLVKRLDRPQVNSAGLFIFLAGMLTGAALTLGALEGRSRWAQTQRLSPPVAPPPAVTTPTQEEEAPTLQAFRRALTHSPEKLDALLDRHAAASHAEEPPITAFSRSEVN